MSRAIFEHAPVGLAEVAGDGTLAAANPALGALVGRGADELTGMAARDLVTSEGRAEAVAALAELAQGHGFRREWPLATADGGTCWTEVNASPARGEAPAVLAFTDIEQRRADAAERDAVEAFYRQTFTNNVAVKLLIDPEDGRIIDANPAAEQFYGYSLEELQGMRIQAINTLSAEEVKAEMEQAAAEERLYFRFRHRVRSGEVRDVEVFSGPVWLHGHQYLHSIIHDVTEARHYEHQLEVYRDLFRTVPVGIYRNTPGPDGRFLEVNPAMVRLFEAGDEAELLATPVRDLYVDPDEREGVARTIQEQGQVEGRELRLRTLAGKRRWIRLSARATTTEGGETVLDGMVEDITAQREMERALEAERDLLNRILETSISAITMADRDGRIIYANRAAERIHGRDRDTIADHTFDDPDWHATDLDGRPLASEELPFHRVVTTGEPIHGFRHAIQWPDGKRRILSINGAPLFDAEGRVERVVFSIDDVTERYEAEREREQLVAILEAAPDYIGLADADGRILYQNPALDAALGMDTADLRRRGLTVEDAHPEWAGRWLRETALPAAVREGRWSGESALYTADGHIRPVYQTLIAHRDETGHPVRYSTIMRDLSAVRAAEAFRRQLLDSLAEGVFGLDTAGRFTFLNPAACELLGFRDEDQALGSNAHELTHHHDARGIPFPEADCPIQQVTRTGAPLDAWEDWFWHRDGHGFPVETYAAPLRDVEGTLTGVVVSFQDITRRKTAEAARDRVLAILDATPDFVSMADSSGRITYINRGGLQMLGEDPERTGLERPLPERMQGERAGELAHPEWARAIIGERGIPTAAEQGVWQGETALIDAEGREIPTSQVILAHYDAAGSVAHFSTILRDISERRAFERRLRREKAFSDAILDNLPGIFYMIDADGRFIRWNEQLEAVTGHDGEALSTLAPRDLFPAEERGAIDERIRAVFETGATTVEGHLCHRDGTRTPYYLTGFRVELEEQAYLLGVGLDISELQAARAELERSNAELEQFAYAVSHDLQEPLRIVASYLGLLQRRYADQLDERAARYIETAVGAGERMRGMISDLLEYSRVKRMGEPFQPVDLGEVVDAARENLVPAIDESGARIAVEELPTVPGDRGQLLRLFQNLLGNAIKYGPDDDTPRIRVSARPDDGHWTIEVADNGIGMEPADTERIFGVFQRLHTREEYPGTGAGLALAQRIVERHGGTIRAESEGPGCGTTFRLTLPAAEDPA
ncbi:MAG: PAS domain S-box protein [Thiohalospira sp.]